MQPFYFVGAENPLLGLYNIIGGSHLLICFNFNEQHLFFF